MLPESVQNQLPILPVCRHHLLSCRLPNPIRRNNTGSWHQTDTRGTSSCDQTIGPQLLKDGSLQSCLVSRQIEPPLIAFGHQGCSGQCRMVRACRSRVTFSRCQCRNKPKHRLIVQVVAGQVQVLSARGCVCPEAPRR